MKRLILFSAALLLTATTPSVRAADSASLRAGAVAVDISPPTFPRIIAGGMREGRAVKNNDPLHARCIVLDDGKTKLAFAIVDTCMMSRQLIDEAKALASRQTGIPADHIMVSATHTHSAPAAMGCLGTRLDKDYAAFLTPKIAEGIATAAKNLQPARIGWASVDDWEHTHNRRWIRRPETKVVDPFGNATGLAHMHPGYLSANVVGPSGPVDPGLSVLSVQTRDGKPLAVLANYSQHYFGAGAVSADYYGYFCKHVAELLGQPGDGNGPFVCAISQGTSGDLMWMDYGSPKKTLTTDSYAEAVAKYAERALKQVQYRDDVPLAMVEKKLTLNYRVPDEKRLEWARPIAAKIENDVPKDIAEVYAREALILHERQKTEIVLQAIRIGDLTISTLPNEVYALTGLKLKAQSPSAMHFNIELANGGDGYIPTPEQHVLGGYTTWPARTAGLEVQAEPKEIATLLTALEEVTGKKRRAMDDEHGPYARAVLDAKPAAYWRLNDAAGKTARNAVSGGAPAQISDGAAWYLPGVGSGTGWGVGEKLTPSAFSGPKQINRAIHLAGGDVQADVKALGKQYTVALWFWLGETSGASERSGTLVIGPGGETLACKQGKDHRVQLSLGDATTKAELRADDWHFAVLARDGDDVRVAVDGEPQIAATLPAKTKGTHLTFGQGVQGKLDEIAIFDRSLPAAEVAALWKISGIAEQHVREAAERERAKQEIAARTRQPIFDDAYKAALAALKPAVRKDAPRDVFSLSFWFRNDLANNSRAVTAYLASRGPAGDASAPGDHLGIGGSFRPSYEGRLLYYNGNARAQTLLGNTTIAPGTWNHAVFIREGARVSAFLNGKLELSGEADVTAPNARALFTGQRSDGFAPLEGTLTEFAVFDRALAAAEVAQLFATVTLAPVQPPSPNTPALPPAESQKKIHVPAGFKVELVASEPMLLDPVAFDWDERGRLWVVEMADYPLGMDNAGKPGGRVRVLEDTDGDGRYEKSTLFADGLNFPNGLLTWRDGVIVTAAPNILFIRDTNGDGRADEQTVLVGGLQEGNQQLRANGLRWGLDNWVYVAAGGHHGKYGVDTKLKSTRTGEEVLVGSRDFRFRPDTGALEPQSGPTQFGRNRDNWGHWFGSQNSNPLWEYVLPDQYLRRNPHAGVAETRVQLLTPPNPPVFPASPLEKRYHSFDQSGHYTSGCSGMVLRDTRLFPAGEIHGFACEPFHNLVQHARLTDSGVTFTANRATGEGPYDFFASEDRWTRPVMVREGPDGALWVADMYRYMIEHPQFLPPVGKDELLPHYRAGDDRGRIYRVSREGAPAFRAVRFDKMSTAEVVAALDTTNGWQRDKAQQVLLWRLDKAAVAPLHELATKSANPLARLHALCTLDGLGELTPAEIAHALSDKTPGVRENALRLAETRFTPEVLSAALRLVDDADAKVRLQLAFSLGASTDAQAGEALAKLLKANASEPMIVSAVMSSATSHLRALARVGEPIEPLLNTALGTNDREALAELLRPDFTSASLAQLLDLLAQHNSSLEALRGSKDDALAKTLAKADAAFAKARSAAGDANASPTDRIAAAALLSRNPAMRADAMNALSAWLEPQHPAEVQAAALRALGETGAKEVPATFAKAWPAFSPATRDAAFAAWVSREPWAFDFVQRIERGELVASAVDTVRRSRLLKHDSPRVRQLATKLFSSATSAARSKAVDSYRAVLSMKGDAAKGRDIYLRNCAICHKRGSDGKDIGPDLASVVEHPPEKLLASILDPNADIQPGFNGYTCTLKSGEQIYGLVASETANSVTMKLADASLKTVLRAQIASLQSQNLSLMPEGLEAAVTKEDMANLIEFLRTPVVAGNGSGEPFIRVREVISYCPNNPYWNSMTPELKRKFFMTYWSEEHLRRHLEMLKAFGFNSLEVTIVPQMARNAGMKPEEWRRRTLFLCRTARELGLSLSQFVWASVDLNSQRHLDWHKPEERAQLEAQYRDQAELAPEVDRVITHWIDPGGPARGCKDCTIETAIEMHNAIMAIFRAKNPKIRGCFSTWLMGLHGWPGHKGTSQLAASQTLDHESEVAFGVSNRGADGISLDKLAQIKASDLDAFAAAGRRAAVWCWYTADVEIEPALHVRTDVMQNYFRSLPPQAHAGLSFHTIDDTSSGLNMADLYVAGHLMRDPSLDAHKLLEEFVRGFVGEANVPAVVAALRAVEQTRTRSRRYNYIPYVDAPPVLPPSWIEEIAVAVEAALAGLKTVKFAPGFKPAWPVTMEPAEYVDELGAHLEAIRQMLAFLKGEEEVKRMKASGATVAQLEAAIAALPKVVYDPKHTAGLETQVYGGRLAALKKQMLGKSDGAPATRITDPTSPTNK